jgi:hypothetical protein
MTTIRSNGRGQAAPISETLQQKKELRIKNKIQSDNNPGQKYPNKSVTVGRVTRGKDCFWTHDCFRCKVCFACLM